MVREIIIASLLAAPATASNTTEITVLIFNYSASPSHFLEEAEREVSAIYKRVGVAIVWRNCAGFPDAPGIGSGICAQRLTSDGSVVALRIVDGLAIDPRNSYRDSANVLGYSTGAYATVSYERSWKVSVQTGEARTHVLACAIAHELGHVFLGTESHSRLGLMQVDAKSMLRSMRQGFTFSDAESARLAHYLSTHRPQDGSPTLARRKD